METNYALGEGSGVKIFLNPQISVHSFNNEGTMEILPIL
jgi:hypothetical protein